MEAFATEAQLQTHLELDSIDAVRAELLLANASAAIRAEVGQVLSLVTDDEVTVDPDGGLLLLPEIPVLSVSAVTVDDVALDPTAWHVRRSGVLRVTSVLYPTSTVQVTYTHGLDPLPDALRGLCLQIAGRLYSNPESLTSETVGAWSGSRGPLGGIVLSEDEKRALDPFRP